MRQLLTIVHLKDKCWLIIGNWSKLPPPRRKSNNSETDINLAFNVVKNAE
jgi:hypothetical protein